MTRKVTITNTEPADAGAGVKVTVVTAGDASVAEKRHLLAGGQQVEIELGAGQFVMVEETDKEGL